MPSIHNLNLTQSNLSVLSIQTTPKTFKQCVSTLTTIPIITKIRHYRPKHRTWPERLGWTPKEATKSPSAVWEYSDEHFSMSFTSLPFIVPFVPPDMHRRPPSSRRSQFVVTSVASSHFHPVRVSHERFAVPRCLQLASWMGNGCFRWEVLWGVLRCEEMCSAGLVYFFFIGLFLFISFEINRYDRDEMNDLICTCCDYSLLSITIIAITVHYYLLLIIIIITLCSTRQADSKGPLPIESPPCSVSQRNFRTN